MNKKQKQFFILGIISFLIGFTMIIICSLNEELDIQLTLTVKIIVGIFGIVFMIGALTCLLIYLKYFFNQDEDFRIGEHDERNTMIRGKASEISMVIFTFVMVIVEFILLCTGDLMPALLLGISLVLCNFAHLLLIGYYQKKY